jgi:hypothetical protein
MRSLRHLVIAAAIAILLAESARGGTVLTLSDFSSDETSPAVLDASLDFLVQGDMLHVTVTNETPATGGYDIDAVYFNAGPGVDGLELMTPVDGWSLATSQRADGFGTFDFALETAGANDPFEIAPQESVTFQLHVDSAVFVGEAAFTTDMSSIPPGSRSVVAAAKFTNGPGDDSAFGAVIPEPGTLALLAVGLLAAIRRRT